MIDEDDLSEALRALAHADRRTFVRVCGPSERSAGELAELTRLSLPTVSEHLKVLRKTGLLVLDRRGRNWIYRTDAPRLAAVSAAVRALGVTDGT